MANTYSWIFPQLEVYPTYASQTNVVFTVHWIMFGTNDLTPPTSAQVYGTQQVTYEAGSPFTPYDQLTQEQVQGWVTDAVGAATVANYQATVDQMILDILDPSVQALPPPWAQSNS